MRADGSAGVSAQLRAGATLPGLAWLITGSFVTGIVLLASGGLLVGLAVPQLDDRRPRPRAVPPRSAAGSEGVGVEQRSVR
jgi:hypothetical protein